MRPAHDEASTHRRAPAVLGPEHFAFAEPNSEAPTFLPATRLPVKEKTERSAHQVQPEYAPPPRATPRSIPAVEAPPECKSASSSSSRSTDKKRSSESKLSAKRSSSEQRSRSSSRGGSQTASAPAAASDARASAPEMGMIDPLAVPVPPELGPTIYGWIRRLALQNDLTTADRILRDALLEVSSSLSCMIVYPGQDGLWTLGADDEIPKEAGPIVAVAQARRAVVASHTALIPIVTTTECVAVIILTRNPRNPGYQPIEQLAMLGLARESAAILHHLAVQHLQKATELEADKGSLYRPEALEAHRSRGTEGAPIHISPVWVRRAYPLIVLAVLVAAAFSIFIKVPTYSTGRGVVILDGITVTAPAMGTVEKLAVAPGQAVAKGTILVKLQAAAEQDELANAKAELDNATRPYLSEQSDETAKKQLASIWARYNTAKSKLEQRTIRAPKAGTISDIRTRGGALLQPGDPIAMIVEGGNTLPEVFAFLPAKDRPRLFPGQTLQVGLSGYTKIRELAEITYVAREGIGATEVAKLLGPSLGDALRMPQDGSYVLVKARLPRRTFETDHAILPFHHGMQADTEVKIAEKPFLVTLFPALEKYVPTL
ncbi:MAG: HlyD family efflux transporter periplasmic adaptor subunit [Myxococcales bacterium]|nr:HlyD family efflux transporter periplasmic adaptor subunit [Myxococcales bacterium]